MFKLAVIPLKKENYFRSIILLGMCFWLTSCMSIGTVQIEVIKPAKIILPAKINSLLVLNNCLLYHNDSFNNEVQRGLFQLDTLTTQLLCSNLAAILNESPRFDTSKLVKEIYYRRQQDLLQALDYEAVNNLCTQYGADALVSLEAFGITDTLLKMNYFDGYGYTVYKSLALVVNSMWRIYPAGEGRVLEKRIQRDTLYLEDIASKRDYYQALTKSDFLKSIATEMALESATQVADRLAPYWQPELRVFYVNGTHEMQQAANYAYADNWRAAAIIWKGLTENANARLAAAACHNMALVCEVEGKLDIAMQWQEQSLEKYISAHAQIYYEELKLRIQEKTLLDKQFGME